MAVTTSQHGTKKIKKIIRQCEQYESHYLKQGELKTHRQHWEHDTESRHGKKTTQKTKAMSRMDHT